MRDTGICARDLIRRAQRFVRGPAAPLQERLKRMSLAMIGLAFESAPNASV
jgi:hypothetical protein